MKYKLQSEPNYKVLMMV